MREINWNAFKKDKVRINFLNPNKKSFNRPNREGLKILKEMENEYVTTYPRKCKNDEQKFLHLTKLFMTSKIEQPMYIEFADVLKFQHPLWIGKEEEKVSEAIEKKLLSLISWN